MLLSVPVYILTGHVCWCADLAPLLSSLKLSFFPSLRWAFFHSWHSYRARPASVATCETFYLFKFIFNSFMCTVHVLVQCAAISSQSFIESFEYSQMQALEIQCLGATPIYIYIIYPLYIYKYFVFFSSRIWRCVTWNTLYIFCIYFTMNAPALIRRMHLPLRSLFDSFRVSCLASNFTVFECHQTL